MSAQVMSATDPNVEGVIPLYILGDYRYTAGIIAQADTGERVLAMGRHLRDARSLDGFEMVPVGEFPDEIVAVATNAFPTVRPASSDEDNKFLVERYLVPGLRLFYMRAQSAAG